MNMQIDFDSKELAVRNPNVDYLLGYLARQDGR